MSGTANAADMQFCFTKCLRFGSIVWLEDAGTVYGMACGNGGVMEPAALFA